MTTMNHALHHGPMLVSVQSTDQGNLTLSVVFQDPKFFLNLPPSTDHVPRQSIPVLPELQVPTQLDHVDEQQPGHVTDPMVDPMRAVPRLMQHVRRQHVIDLMQHQGGHVTVQ